MAEFTHHIHASNYSLCLETQIFVEIYPFFTTDNILLRALDYLISEKTEIISKRGPDEEDAREERWQYVRNSC